MRKFNETTIRKDKRVDIDVEVYIDIEDVTDWLSKAKPEEINKVKEYMGDDDQMVDNTLDNDLKKEIINKVWKKLTYYQLEELLKNYL